MKNNTNKSMDRIEEKKFLGGIEYKMPAGMARAYLKNRNESEKKMQTNDYLCQIVNSEFGLKGYCVKVIVD